MRAAVEARNAERYLGATRSLRALLQHHNSKEENMMYPMLDQALGEDAPTVFGKLRRSMAGSQA